MLRNWMFILTVLGLYFGCLGTAHAADPLTVVGVKVDARGKSAIEAQTQAISEGQLRAANILIERLTLEQDRNAKPLKLETALKMIRGMSIGNEKRSSNRYLGVITVAFNPSAVQAYLKAGDMTMISTQANERLVIPVISGKLASGRHPWGAAWGNAAFEHALTPVKSVPRGQRLSLSASDVLSGNMTALKAEGAARGVRQILIAEATDMGGSISVSLSDVSLDGETTTTVGTVTGSTYKQAAAAAVKLLQDKWKSSSVSQIENAQDMVVSVLYGSHADWQTLQTVLNGSAQIIDSRLDALSKDGAMMTITYGGDTARLANELSYKGVTFEQTQAFGPVIRLTGMKLPDRS